MNAQKPLLAGIVTLAVTAGSFAGVTKVIVHVDGMACPFCAYNIEKRMKTLDGVARDAEFNVSVERGIAELAWKEDVAFDPNAVRDQVRRAGFTPGGISITAEGAVQTAEENDHLQLVDEKTGEVIAIRVGKRVDRNQSFEALRAKAQAATSAEPLRAIVSGPVEGDGEDWNAVLHRWEPVEFGAALIVNVQDLVCENCVRNVVEHVSGVDGVIHAEADFESDRVWVWMESEAPDVGPIKNAISEAGFTVTHVHEQDDGEER